MVNSKKVFFVVLISVFFEKELFSYLFRKVSAKMAFMKSFWCFWRFVEFFLNFLLFDGKQIPKFIFDTNFDQRGCEFYRKVPIISTKWQIQTV